MGKGIMVHLSCFLIGIWLMIGSAFAEPLGNLTAKFTFNVTDTFAVGVSKNKEAKNRNLIAQNPPDRKREDRYGQIDAALAAALQAKDINRLFALVEQTRAENCDFYQKADEQYKKLQCCDQILDELRFVVYSADITTFYTYDVKQFRALMEEAKALNCFSQNYYLYEDWLNRREQRDERCRQIGLALAAASKAKDINRFRELAERARVEQCNFYQDANHYLQNWE